MDKKRLYLKLKNLKSGHFMAIFKEHNNQFNLVNYQMQYINQLNDNIKL